MNIKTQAFLFSIVMGISFVTKAQLNDQPINLPKYDMQPIHFGFVLAVNSASFHVNRAGDLRWRDSVYTIEAQNVTGINLGIVSNIRINDYFDFRFIPVLSFVQRNLQYTFIYADSVLTPTPKKIESSYLEFPFELKFKSKRLNNYRVYVLAGYKYSFDMISQAKVNQQDKDLVKLNRADYGYEIGIGFDFYLTYFKFSPEIKMYNGLRNLLVGENTKFSSPLEGLYAKTFTVSLYFE